ncbi:hypothetical protein IMY05_018G0103900 [Salix suchowensis]|nr:hypothetical protein IMY05_018G0103900 [Salix suchowensis]
MSNKAGQGNDKATSVPGKTVYHQHQHMFPLWGYLHMRPWFQSSGTNPTCNSERPSLTVTERVNAMHVWTFAVTNYNMSEVGLMFVPPQGQPPPSDPAVCIRAAHTIMDFLIFNQNNWLDQENSQLLEGEKNSSRRLEVSDFKRKNDGVWWEVSSIVEASIASNAQCPSTCTCIKKRPHKHRFFGFEHGIYR